MIKPILFNTEMVRAILEGCKTVTRRVVKPKYCDSVFELFHGELCEVSPYKPPIDNGDGTKICFVRAYVPCKPPYHPGDILYVRETFCRQHSVKYPFVYKASVETPAAWSWKPSIHMPRDAARLFLRVTDVRVERLQEISSTDCITEGAPGMDKRFPVGNLGVFVEFWDSTIKPAGRALYSWDANPWVWVIQFERCERPEEGAP